MARRLLKGRDLEQRADELGVSRKELYHADSSGMSEPELQRRVLEAERAVRENRLWLVAVLSAAVAVISAVGAWVAVLR